MKDAERHAASHRRRTSMRRIRPGSSIRPARPEDAETLATLVRELAVYEKLEQYAQGDAR